MGNLLEVSHLRVAFRREGREIVPVRDVSFTVPEHGRVALVGESGCGKSLTALSLAGLPPIDRATVSGTIAFNAPADRPQARLAYVFQNPVESLNPVMRIRDQIREALPKGMDRKAGDARIVLRAGGDHRGEVIKRLSRSLRHALGVVGLAVLAAAGNQRVHGVHLWRCASLRISLR